MATNAQGKPAAGDFTGQQKSKLAEQHASEQKARAQELATASSVEADAASNEILDVTKSPERPTVISDVEDVTSADKPKAAKVVAPAAVVDQVAVVDDAEGDGVTVRFNEDLQQVTIGDRTYDFIAGRRYKVPRNVAFHLEEQGKVWH